MKNQLQTLINRTLENSDFLDNPEHLIDKSVLFFLAQDIVSQLTKTNAKYIGFQSSLIGLINEDSIHSDAVDAVAFLILNHPNLCNRLDPHDYGFDKWCEFEEHEWKWFASQILEASTQGEDETYFLLKSTVQTGVLTLPIFSTIKASNKAMKPLLEVMHAQGCYPNLNFVDSDNAFTNGELSVKKGIAQELSRDEFFYFSDISDIHNFDSIEDLGNKCDVDQVRNSLLNAA